MNNRIRKNAAISDLIIREVESGKTVREAIDSVCGAGSFDRLAEELYRELRAKSGLTTE